MYLLANFERNGSEGCYMKKNLALLRRERENWPIISKCIEEMRQKLEKYEYFRSANQMIDNILEVIEVELYDYSYDYRVKLRTRDVEDRKKKTKYNGFGFTRRDL